MLTLLLLAAPAFATTPIVCGTAAAPVGCTDTDKDGAPTNAVDVSKNDCDDADARVYPGARLVLFDGKDTDCNGTDDDAEKAEAVTAARDVAAKRADKADPTSAKAVAAADAAAESFINELDRCEQGGGFVNDADGGVWGWDGPTAKIPNCFDAGFGITYERGKNGVGYITPADRRALGTARKAQADATTALETATAAQADASEALVILRGENDSDGLVVMVGDIAHTVYGIDEDGDGYAETPGVIDAVLGLENSVYGIDVDGDGKTDKPGVLDRLKGVETGLETLRLTVIGKDGTGGLKKNVADLEASDKAQNVRIGDLEASRPIVRVGVDAFVWGGVALYEYEGGPSPRSGTIGGLGASFEGGSTVGRNGNGYIGATITAGAGGTSSFDKTVGGGALVTGLFYQRMVGDFGIGPVAFLGMNATGNFLAPTVSGIGGGGGLKASYSLPSASRTTCSSVDGTVGGLVENYGSNGAYFDGGAAYVSLGVSYGICPN